MNNSPLFSKEWCDLIFENRNREYGAYVLRRDMGVRYRCVGIILGGILFLFVGLSISFRWLTFRKTNTITAELEQIVKLKPIATKDGFEVKQISGGRRASSVVHTPGGTMATPEVVNRKTIAIPLGIDGPDNTDIIDRSLLTDKDLHHNTDQTDLPVEGPQLTATEVVEVMPMFPGGIPALMTFLEKNVVYAGSALRRKVEGSTEVSFIVNLDGTLSDVEIISPIDDSLKRSLINAIRRMPKWKPGKKGNSPTTVRVTIPVEFHLQ